MSFPPGSAGGLDGITSQHLKDLTSGCCGDAGEKLLQEVTNLCNLMLRGEVASDIVDILYGANLCALRKRDGGIRPIAVGSTYRRLTAKIACSVVHTAQAAYEFPPGFRFGAATAAYQVEGGWNEDGKGPTIWDKLVHSSPNKVLGNVTGDVAADSYHKWLEDVQITADLGLHFYRFSISWSRILPTGFSNRINRAGVRYYSDLIDALLAEGVEPVVTMYHWDLPQPLQDLGGWTNPLIVDWFEDYARVLFAEFADRVKTWITINEAISVCDFNYNFGGFAPGILEPEFAPFLCNKYILLAHATAYRIYEKEYKAKYNGKISLANNILWMEPATPEDLALAELGRQHSIGRYSHPIFSKVGGWPPSTEETMLNYSLKQGYKKSRLPAFTEDEKLFIKGTADFYSVNYYTTYLIRPERAGDEPGKWFLTGSPEIGATCEAQGALKGATQIMMPVVPQGLRRILQWIKREYGNMEIMIAENGFSTKGVGLDDFNRIEYIEEHLKQVLLAINEDNITVTGYTYWSLLDNFEWLDGFSSKFGLYAVDFNKPERTRTPRASAHYYSCVINVHALNDSCVQHARDHVISGSPLSENRIWMFVISLLILI
ncbi:myrosinase 1-like [Aricia agestis]|uniref:myrosinase 1-like n=1 Tax=Aricia agestis TaxID=91739 RepID=UPI001C2076CC|nr:myrosinase 1-like [Aricia agestis]